MRPRLKLPLVEADSHHLSSEAQGFAPSLEWDLARLDPLGLRQCQREHAIGHFSAELVVIEAVRCEIEAALIVANVVFGVDRMHLLVSGEVNPTRYAEYSALA